MEVEVDLWRADKEIVTRWCAEKKWEIVVSYLDLDIYFNWKVTKQTPHCHSLVEGLNYRRIIRLHIIWCRALWAILDRGGEHIFCILGHAPQFPFKIVSLLIKMYLQVAVGDWAAKPGGVNWSVSVIGGAITEEEEYDHAYWMTRRVKIGNFWTKMLKWKTAYSKSST